MTYTDQRTPGKLGSPGPFLAEVVSNFDPSYMGGLDVVVYRNDSPPPNIDNGFAVSVKYLSPFYSVTSARFEGNNSSDFNDVQKSHGMWMVPPDVGTKVLVIFVDSDVNQGYWIGCVPDMFQNHMVPGIAASKDTQITQEQFRRYGTSNLPVAEFLKKTLDLGICRNPSTIVKAIHPFADRLLAQGLLLDNVRGTTTSSARRESPSNVFGISTPGPKDTSTGAKKGNIGYEQKIPVFVSRLGGSTFVMDDGDSDGQNELVRIRTRTGHQILLHNSHDLIYIANSKGTAWIELTSNGKIDIYANDSISIHTENDFNFRADRDINLEAGRNINIKTNNDFNVDVVNNYNLIVDENGKFSFGAKFNLTSQEEMLLSSGFSLNIKSGSNSNITSLGNFNVSSDGNNNLTSNANTNISSAGNHIETASKIFMNGPTAEIAQQADTAEVPEKLPIFTLPNRSKTAGWNDGNFYRVDSITSIMQRVPTHEPWEQHENISPDSFSPRRTDSYAAKGWSESSNLSSVPMNENQPKDWREDKEFIEKAKQVAKQLKADVVDLLAVIAFETGGTFNPSLRNFIGATGLIQFIPSTARGLGTTTDYLAGLTRTEQLDWVLKYYQQTPIVRVASPTLSDLYAAVLWPRAVGKPDNYILFSKGERAYEQNPIDKDNKGFATKADATRLVQSRVAFIKSTLEQIESRA